MLAGISKYTMYIETWYGGPDIFKWPNRSRESLYCNVMHFIFSLDVRQNNINVNILYKNKKYTQIPRY